ncbi:putative membrane protein [Microbacterium testaceum]|uniref:DUF732 domain-containing protein n=1 Tax=Microbacterium testaceum TaxID=2033 RepID=UPI00277D6226|nr:DUF732 domain-containing protein [Microbacterium testaceum]MDQ1174162.1 putative membrane protein [Microbacterium testaceum]
MKRTVTAAAIAAALLLLAGCSAGTQENVSVNSAPAVSDAPLTAETPAATVATGDAAFVEEVRSELRPNNVIPNATDEQLLEAGQKACEGIAAGADTLTLSVIDGEQTDASGFYPDSAVIISTARATICG